MQNFRLEKGTPLTHEEGDDNLRFPHLWDAAKTFKQGMEVFDGADFHYLCIQDVLNPNTIPLNDPLYWKKLSQTPTLNLNDLGDVNITTPTVGQRIIWSGTEFINDDGSLSIIDVTYNQLTNLISTNGLTPGVYYRLEYSNIHGIDGTSDKYTGNVENLLLIGITSNTISKQAYSESFPNDTIFYDQTNNLAEDGVTQRPGFIERRISNDNSISTPFDFRNTKVRRYKQDNPIWTPSTAYALGDVVLNSNSLFGCVETHVSGVSFATDKTLTWCKLFDMPNKTWNEYFIPGSVLGLGFEVGGFNVAYDSGDFNDFDVFEDLSTTFNVLIGDNLGTDTSNTLGDIIIGSGVKDLQISSGCAGINIGPSSEGVEIKAGCGYVIIGAECFNTEVSNGDLVIIGDYSSNNKVSGNSNRVTISEYTLANEISLSSDCSIGDNSSENKIVSATFSRCLPDTEGNNIHTAAGCYLGRYAKYNTFSTCVTGKIGEAGLRNSIIDSGNITLSGSASYNEILASNIISIKNNSDSNKILTSSFVHLDEDCKNNEISDSNNITIGDNCVSLEVLSGCNSTTFGNGCRDIYVSFSGSVTWPAGSINCRIENCTSVIFSDINQSVEDINISATVSLVIGAACKHINVVNGSALITLGANCSAIKINSSGQLTLGDNCDDCEISFSGTTVLGSNNNNVKIIASSNIITEDGNNGLMIYLVTTVILGNLNKDINLENSSAITIGDSNETINIEKTTNSSVVDSNEVVSFNGTSFCIMSSSCKVIEVSGGSNLTINSNNENIRMLNACINVTTPDGALKTTYDNCTNVVNVGVITIQDCYFKALSDVSLQADLLRVTTLQKVSNKTITANFTDVLFSIPSNTVETLAVAKADRNYNSVSPNGQVWAVLVDDLGTITNESLS